MIMAVDKSIFPDDCYMAGRDNGKLSPMAEAFLEGQKLMDWNGQGAEHPCFGCGFDCAVRVVKYHDQTKKYIAPPKNPKPF
jgi:hypothetical protein